MSRYAKGRIRAGWIEDDTFSPDPGPLNSLTVDDHEAVETGLIWETGEPIMRIPNPIGFGRDDEW